MDGNLSDFNHLVFLFDEIPLYFAIFEFSSKKLWFVNHEDSNSNFDITDFQNHFGKVV